MKRLIVERNGMKFGTQSYQQNMKWGTFDFVVFIVILGSLGARFSKWPVIRKPLSAERNGLKFETHLYQQVYGVHLAPVVVNVILESFGALVPKWPVTGKRMVKERNWSNEIWGLGYLYGCILYTFEFQCSRLFGDNHVHFSKTGVRQH